MIYLIITIFLSASLNIIYKIAAQHDSNRFAVTMFNNLTALIGSYLMLGVGTRVFSAGWLKAMSAEFGSVVADGASKFSLEGSLGFAVALAVLGGIGTFFAYYLLQLSTAKNGTALTSAFNKTGVLVPAVLSVIFFHESPSAVQTAGVVLAMAAILMVYLRRDDGTAVTMKGALLGTFLLGGLVDFVSKIYEYYALEAAQPMYIFYIFVFSLAVAVISFAVKKGGCRPVDVIVGVVSGIPSLFIASLLLKALVTLPAFIIFPLYSVGVILVVNVCNLIFFKEKLSRVQVFAILIMIGAVVLLNL